ncbi:MAG TPA: RNA 2',3'-cyclic phosphodiesterase [Paracoccaceae bacterium]|nr:RNA 2',3'-cyclic phosphodiesterase [Paracoccaceae bacterium]
MRLFAALPLPYDTIERLERLQAGLPEGRATQAESLHVTLGFFDECDRHMAADIDAGLAAIRGEAMELWFDGLGTFGDHRPRVLYAAVRPDPRLSRLRDKVLAAVRGAGIELRRERFVPHVTLARFGNGEGRGARMDRWLAARAGFAAGPVRIGAFCLYRSDLGGGGAVHTVLARYALDT